MFSGRTANVSLVYAKISSSVPTLLRKPPAVRRTSRPVRLDIPEHRVPQAASPRPRFETRRQTILKNGKPARPKLYRCVSPRLKPAVADTLEQAVSEIISRIKIFSASGDSGGHARFGNGTVSLEFLSRSFRCRGGLQVVAENFAWPRRKQIVRSRMVSHEPNTHPQEPGLPVQGKRIPGLTNIERTIQTLPAGRPFGTCVEPYISG